MPQAAAEDSLPEVLPSIVISTKELEADVASPNDGSYSRKDGVNGKLQVISSADEELRNKGRNSTASTCVT